MTSTRELHTDGNYNRKPYRSKELKRLARENAVKVDGRFVSKTPVLRHPVRVQKRDN